MKILFIAPIPPPIDGQSKVSKVLLNKLLETGHDVAIINLSKTNLKSGFSSAKRVLEVISILFEVYKKCQEIDVVYLSLAESHLGNLRDLFIYSICKNYKKRIIIHMLGGAGMNRILSGRGLQAKVNKFFLSDIDSVIVEGPLNFELFAKIINRDKIHIVPNFAEEELFVTDKEIENKFKSLSILNMLFLSNLIKGKGHIELLKAYKILNKEHKERINLSFVGGFESEKLKREFLQMMEGEHRVKYLGRFIDGVEKRLLYLSSHVFCLPTYYPYEGQPISILEAYATGCVVITTHHSGIPFIFSDVKNGFVVEGKSPNSITMAIAKLFSEINNLRSIAFNNRNEALSKYRVNQFEIKILALFNEVSLKNDE